MHDKVLEKLEEKIRETVAGRDDIRMLSGLAPNADDPGPFVMGVVVGRLYNSFYYQYRRLFGRDPTGGELDEFVRFVESKRRDLERLW